ncbi:unnamed protein product [Clavelina lepadiformis]|uniref:Uncharacterized protein n=1 Tax=Clavelina lepadiformis TaxID=159417 RepID=A0ABP0EY01_CLALP
MKGPIHCTHAKLTFYRVLRPRQDLSIRIVKSGAKNWELSVIQSINIKFLTTLVTQGNKFLKIQAKHFSANFVYVIFGDDSYNSRCIAIFSTYLIESWKFESTKNTGCRSGDH